MDDFQLLGHAWSLYLLRFHSVQSQADATPLLVWPAAYSYALLTLFANSLHWLWDSGDVYPHGLPDGFQTFFSELSASIIVGELDSDYHAVTEG
jgi:hypothetical protein